MNNSKIKFATPFLITFALVCLVGLVTTPAQASNLVLNGGFETTSLSSPGGYFCSDNGSGGCASNVSNWTSVCRNGICGGGATPTSVIFPGTGGSAFNTFGFQSPSADSPVGGNYVAADADPTFNSTISQNITGLVKNTFYNVTFYQASGQQRGSSNSFNTQWQVGLGASTQFSQVISNSGGQFTP